MRSQKISVSIHKEQMVEFSIGPQVHSGKNERQQRDYYCKQEPFDHSPPHAATLITFCQVASSECPISLRVNALSAIWREFIDSL
jgi:hypothetical protein